MNIKDQYWKPTVSICDDLRKGGFVVRMGREIMCRDDNPEIALSWGKWLAETYDLPLRLRVRDYAAFTLVKAKKVGEK